MTMRNDLGKEFKTRQEACEYRDAMIAKGYRSYYEEWCGFDGFFYSVRVFS